MAIWLLWRALRLRCFTDDPWEGHMNGLDGWDVADRERLIASALVEIGAGAGDPIEAAYALTRWSMRLLDVSGAGVMLADDRGALRSVMVTSDLVRTLELVELRYERGPCVESHRNVSAVIHADVTVTDDRWPEFGVLARASGVRAAHAIPVLDNGTAIGVLNLFRDTAGGLSDADAALAQSLADTTGVVIHQRPSPMARLGPGELVSVVADAAVVQRAVGVLAVRLQVDLDTAHAVLRWVARDRRIGLAELADGVLVGGTAIDLPLSIAPKTPDVSGRG